MSEKEKKKPFFQGSDWATARWSAAQAFDSLDKAQDLCLFRTEDVEEGEAPDETETKEDATVLSGLVSDLEAEVGIMELEILSEAKQSHFQGLWRSYEAHLGIESLKKTIREEGLEAETFYDTLLLYLDRLKMALKSLDGENELPAADYQA